MSFVLVADDEPAVLEVLSQVVEDLGHEVVRARDGAEALQRARARRPDLIVTDHMMPRLAGVDLCRALRREEGLADVPVILLSAVLPHGSPEAYAFLAKPFEISEFEALVRRALAHAPLPRGARSQADARALADWVARALEGPLAAARARLGRLRDEPHADLAALAALERELVVLEAGVARLQQDGVRVETPTELRMVGGTAAEAAPRVPAPPRALLGAR